MNKSPAANSHKAPQVANNTKTTALGPNVLGARVKPPPDLTYRTPTIRFSGAKTALKVVPC